MILTCSACSTRYLVDPTALGGAGRRVRCAHCGHVWHQPPPVDAPRPVEPPPLEAKAEGRIQLPALRPPPPRSHGAVWVVAVLVLVALGVGVAWERESIVEMWPVSAKLFAIVGLRTSPPGSGLNLRIETTARATTNGIPELVVDGVVENTSSIARPVPRLKVILRDSAEHELQSHTFSVSQQRLLPGASVPFHTTVDQPADAATQVAVTFAGSG